MSTNKDKAALVGVGAVACAACCAGPILGFLAAIGLGTAVGFAIFGVAAIVIGAAVTLLLVRHRRRRPAGACVPTTGPVAVDMPTMRTPR